MTLYLLLIELTFFVLLPGAIFNPEVGAVHLFERSRSRVLLRWHMPTSRFRIIKQELPWASPYGKRSTLPLDVSLCPALHRMCSSLTNILEGSEHVSVYGSESAMWAEQGGRWSPEMKQQQLMLPERRSPGRCGQAIEDTRLLRWL